MENSWCEGHRKGLQIEVNPIALGGVTEVGWGGGSVAGCAVP